MSQSDFVTRGQALVDSGQFQEAVKVCRLGLLGRPTTVEGRVVLGQALLALKRFDEVLAEMRVALELDHTSITAQMLKGEALLRKGETAAAVEVLQAVRLRAADPRIDELLNEAQNGRPAISASHPSVGFVGGSRPSGSFDENTRHYPNHAKGDDDDGDEATGTGGAFEQPTSISTPGANRRRSGERGAASTPKPKQKMPGPGELSVGDKSGTVEVDPELDGVEMAGEDDFGEAVSPPRGKPQRVENQRGAVIASSRRAALPMPGHLRGADGRIRGADGRNNDPMDISSVELDDDELVEVESGETLLPDRKPPGPGPGTRVRNAMVNVPSGPLEANTATARGPGPASWPNPKASQPTAHEPAMQPPPHLAQLIANAPHVMEVARPQLSMTVRGNPSAPGAKPAPIAAALPTIAAQPAPVINMSTTLAGNPAPINPAAARPTLAIQPDPQQLVPGSPQWARATVAAGHPQGLHPPPGSFGVPAMMPEEPTSRPHQPIDPMMAMYDAAAASAVSAVDTHPPPMASMLEPSASARVGVLKTGMRKTRSKLSIAIWLIIGAGVIAGGVFVGFKFRAMRLEKKINDTRDVANGLAKADTWKGLVRSRDRLAGIAQASPTDENKAALARTRAQIAFEFGDNLPDAEKAVEGLAGQSGLDVEIASTYLALAKSDHKAALAAAGRAMQAAIDDPAALYVTGQAELMAGDTAAAIGHLEKAVEKEGRPLYRIGLARAYAENTQWDEAMTVLEPKWIKSWLDTFDADTSAEMQKSGIAVDKLVSNHPAVAIARAQIATLGGKLGPQPKTVRSLVEDIVREGSKPLNDQERGVSPAQVAFGHIALALIDFSTNSTQVKADFQAALAVGLDDQGFGETAAEALFFTNDLTGAHDAIEIALKEWPGSRRVRLVAARLALAQGKPREGMDALGKLDVDKLAGALAVRGQLRVALGDLDAAKADFDKAIEKSNKKLEPALVGRSWVDLAGGKVDDARARMRPQGQAVAAGKASPAVVAVWAAILRAGGVAAEREDARAYLEKVVNGPASADLMRAQLELARAYRDIGDTRAGDLYARVYEATGNPDVKLELATYLIDFKDPSGGRTTLDALLAAAGDKPSATLVLEAARAHMLVGDHKRAAELLDQADKLADTVRWKYDRERARLELRKADINGAALSIEKALDKCGDDAETFMLAAEIASSDDKHASLADLVKKQVDGRLKDLPEAKIVKAKLLGSSGDEAAKLFDAAKLALDKAAPRRKAQAHLGLGIVAYNLQDDPRALDSFEFATTLDPSLYEAYIYMADILKDKDAKKALAKAQAAIAANPDNADGYVRLGFAAHKLGDRKMLAEAITKVNALAPQSQQLKDLQALR